MNKMVINHLEKLFVTNDAATILRELEVNYSNCEKNKNKQTRTNAFNSEENMSLCYLFIFVCLSLFFFLSFLPSFLPPSRFSTQLPK